VIPRALAALTLGSALASGLMAGVFFAFSTFLMTALSAVGPAPGVRAMQAINIAVFNRCFMGVLFGNAAACVVLALASVLAWSQPGSRWRLAGSLLYLGGVIVVTACCNVPRNEALAAVVPDSADVAVVWARYVSGWSAWNHVRTVASLAAATALTLALTGCDRDTRCAEPQAPVDGQHALTARQR